MRIAVTAGFGKSLHTITLIHQLADRGHDVALGLEVGVLSIRRLQVYLRRLGWRGLYDKVRSKLLTGRPDLEHAEEVIPMREYMAELGITARSVSAACDLVQARHLKVKNLNDPRAINALRQAQLDLIVYSGGGILKKTFIESARLGVLNAHGGPLPEFRGMNVAEWALFHGVPPVVTVHQIDIGIDTGPILLEKPIPREAWASISRGRGVATRVGVQALLEAVDNIANDRTKTRPQDPGIGRQYFVLAPPLLEVIQYWLDRKMTPPPAGKPNC